MAECVPKCAVSTHAETGNCSCTRVGNGLIMLVDIADKFLADISLKTDFGIDVAVKVPRCVSVGTYKYDAILIPIICCVLSEKADELLLPNINVI